MIPYSRQFSWVKFRELVKTTLHGEKFCGLPIRNVSWALPCIDLCKNVRGRWEYHEICETFSPMKVSGSIYMYACIHSLSFQMPACEWPLLAQSCLAPQWPTPSPLAPPPCTSYDPIAPPSGRRGLEVCAWRTQPIRSLEQLTWYVT